MPGLSPSLERAYASLWSRHAMDPFAGKEAHGLLGGSLNRTRVLLSRLVAHGWAVRLGEGRYELLRALVPFSDTAEGWSRKVRARATLDVIRVALSQLDGALGDRLLAVALFGSHARGDARPQSDLDLLVVVGRPELASSERSELITGVGQACAPLLSEAWKRTGWHPVPQVVVFTWRELEAGSTFLLDLAQDAIPLYERNGALSRSLRDLRARAASLGVLRIDRPDGRWYWVVPKGRSLSALGGGA